MNKRAILDKWLEERPKIVQDTARKYPPWKQFVLKGQEDVGVYTPLAYSEDGTIRCHKKDWLGFEFEVFGMHPKDLKPAPSEVKANE